FGNRGYTLREDPASPEDPASLKAEYGGELLVFNYGRVNDPQPPKCLKIYPPPGTPWQEAASRATGTPPDKLKAGGTISLPRGGLKLGVDEDQNKLILRI